MSKDELEQNYQAPNAAALFREALAFGLAYGPEIPAHQWDEMREKKVAQLVARLTTIPVASVQPVGDWVWSWLMDWCKRQGVSPSTQDSLFKMVKDSRIKFDK